MQQETKAATDKYKEYKAYAESLDDKVLKDAVTVDEADILKQSKFAEATKDLNQELLKGIKYNTDYAESESLLNKNAKSMSSSFSGIKGKLSSFGSSLKNLAVGVANMVAIQIAISTVMKGFEALDNYNNRIFILSKLIKNKKQLRNIEDKIFGRSCDCRNSIDYIVYMVANGLVICVRLYHKRDININSNPFATIISSKSRNIKRELREEIIFAYNQKKEAEPLVNNFLNTNDTREKILNRYRNKKREK